MMTPAATRKPARTIVTTRRHATHNIHNHNTAPETVLNAFAASSSTSWRTVTTDTRGEVLPMTACGFSL